MKVVVTGGSGVVGKHTIRALAAQGHTVWNLDRSRDGDIPSRFIAVDLSDAGQVYDVFGQIQPDAVCHLAANPQPYGTVRAELFRNNVLATFHVLQAAGDFRVRRVVTASSIWANGWDPQQGIMPERLPLDERDRRTAGNIYGLSKYVGENVADTMAAQFPETAYVTLRLSAVIEESDYTTLAYWREEPQRGLGAFWSYIDARDAATAFVAAVVGGTIGHEVFLIAASDTASDKPLPELIAECCPGYLGLDPSHPPFVSVCNCTKIKRLLGWEPRHSWRDREGSSPS